MPDPLYVINISGPQRAGKTFLGELLAAALRRHMPGFRVRRRALADPLKEMAKILTNDPNFEKDKRYRVGPGGALISGRKVLQKLGTDAIRREFREDIWRDLMESRAEGGEVVVVDDCRFPNERKKGEFAIFIRNSDAPLQTDAHASESHLEALEKTADLIVTRKGNSYSIPVEEIARRAAWKAKGSPPL